MFSKKSCVLNYIKDNQLRSRTLSHTEADGFQNGKILNFFVFTKVEIISFIDTEEVDFSFLKDDVWWLRVSFLSDFFDKLKEVNLSLQEAEENFITIRYKLKAFKEILILWNSKSTNQTLNLFRQSITSI